MQQENTMTAKKNINNLCTLKVIKCRVNYKGAGAGLGGYAMYRRYR